MERAGHCAGGGVRHTRNPLARTGMKMRRFKGLEFGTHHSHKHVARFITSTVATSGIHVEMVRLQTESRLHPLMLKGWRASSVRGPGNTMLAECITPDLAHRFCHFPGHNLGISLLDIKEGRGFDNCFY